MHPIEMADVSDEFVQCWQAAGTHLQDQAGNQIHSWIRAHLTPPFLEHLSFRLGNQLFFILIEDVDDQLKTPSNPDGLLTIADVCKGYACALPMQLVSGDHGGKHSGQWQPTEPGWGLLDARKRQPINPVALISDELIEMTDWELQGFAVKVVRHYLAQVGREIISFNSNPDVPLSIWFVEDDGHEWVSVGAVRYPLRDAPLPTNLSELQTKFNQSDHRGHFASVAVASAKDPQDPDAATNGNYLPLYRGHDRLVKFTGLEPLVSLLE